MGHVDLNVVRGSGEISNCGCDSLPEQICFDSLCEKQPKKVRNEDVENLEKMKRYKKNVTAGSVFDNDMLENKEHKDSSNGHTSSRVKLSTTSLLCYTASVFPTSPSEGRANADGDVTVYGLDISDKKSFLAWAQHRVGIRRLVASPGGELVLRGGEMGARYRWRPRIFCGERRVDASAAAGAPSLIESVRRWWMRRNSLSEDTMQPLEDDGVERIDDGNDGKLVKYSKIDLANCTVAAAVRHAWISGDVLSGRDPNSFISADPTVGPFVPFLSENADNSSFNSSRSFYEMLSLYARRLIFMMEDEERERQQEEEEARITMSEGEAGGADRLSLWPSASVLRWMTSEYGRERIEKLKGKKDKNDGEDFFRVSGKKLNVYLLNCVR